jgi:1-acyl-sn-glycerol-3-phosphate acyltransferase
MASGASASRLPGATRVRALARRAHRFPFGAPSWPATVARPDPERAMIMDNLARPVARTIAPATVRGLEHLRHVEGPVIFAANHSSHVDTPLLLTNLPVAFRHRTVVAAASDYFFDKRWKSVLWSFALAAFPLERTRVNRRSGDTATELIEDGWNLVIFPEGGRSPDGWTQPFTGGAAYLARRTARPVVPVYLHGTRHVLPKSFDVGDGALAPGGSGTEAKRSGRLRRSPISVLFGAPLTPDEGENTHRFAARVESAVATLAREVSDDWWSARRAVSATDPAPGVDTAHRGPDAPAWRRAWALDPPPRRTRAWPD